MQVIPLSGNSCAKARCPNDAYAQSPGPQKEQPDHMPNIDAMIENFDKALAHPDDNDLNALKQLVANNAQ